MSGRDPEGGRNKARYGDHQLGFLMSFLSTTTRLSSGDPENDVLSDLGQARRWAASALAERVTRSGVDLTDIFLEQVDLEPLRAFREELRTALGANRTTATESPARIVATVDVHWVTDGRLGFRPTGTGWRGIAGLLVMDLLLAEASGRLRRLKTCAYAPCGFPFVDNSPSLTRAWHDTRRCGNVVNLRASRARRRADPAS
jgi:predicted RNA-binding Zn ribbon-like protein